MRVRELARHEGLECRADVASRVCLRAVFKTSAATGSSSPAGVVGGVSAQSPLAETSAAAKIAVNAIAAHSTPGIRVSAKARAATLLHRLLFHLLSALGVTSNGASQAQM